MSHNICVLISEIVDNYDFVLLLYIITIEVYMN